MGDDDGGASCHLDTDLHACLENGSKGFRFGKAGEWNLINPFPVMGSSSKALSSGSAEGTLQALEEARIHTQSTSAIIRYCALPCFTDDHKFIMCEQDHRFWTESPLQEEPMDEGTLQAPVQPAELDETTPPQLALMSRADPSSVKDPAPLAWFKLVSKVFLATRREQADFKVLLAKNLKALKQFRELSKWKAQYMQAQYGKPLQPKFLLVGDSCLRKAQYAMHLFSAETGSETGA